MNPSGTKKCPDCTFTMRRIKLFDRVAGKGAPPDGELYYAAADANRTSGSGKYPLQGNVVAYLCGSCRRIVLYGENVEPPIE
jgi:hypothetical protein